MSYVKAVHLLMTQIKAVKGEYKSERITALISAVEKFDENTLKSLDISINLSIRLMLQEAIAACQSIEGRTQSIKILQPLAAFKCKLEILNTLLENPKKSAEIAGSLDNRTADLLKVFHHKLNSLLKISIKKLENITIAHLQSSLTAMQETLAPAIELDHEITYIHTLELTILEASLSILQSLKQSGEEYTKNFVASAKRFLVACDKISNPIYPLKVSMLAKQTIAIMDQLLERIREDLQSALIMDSNIDLPKQWEKVRKNVFAKITDKIIPVVSSTASSVTTIVSSTASLTTTTVSSSASSTTTQAPVTIAPRAVLLPRPPVTPSVTDTRPPPQNPDYSSSYQP